MQHNADVDTHMEEGFTQETMLELIELEDGKSNGVAFGNDRNLGLG